jgi:hypothetical protein
VELNGRFLGKKPIVVMLHIRKEQRRFLKEMMKSSLDPVIGAQMYTGGGNHSGPVGPFSPPIIVGLPQSGLMGISPASFAGSAASLKKRPVGNMPGGKPYGGSGPVGPMYLDNAEAYYQRGIPPPSPVSSSIMGGGGGGGNGGASVSGRGRVATTTTAGPAGSTRSASTSNRNKINPNDDPANITSDLISQLTQLRQLQLDLAMQQQFEVQQASRGPKPNSRYEDERKRQLRLQQQQFIDQQLMNITDAIEQLRAIQQNHFENLQRQHIAMSMSHQPVFAQRGGGVGAPPAPGGGGAPGGLSSTRAPSSVSSRDNLLTSVMGNGNGNGNSASSASSIASGEGHFGDESYHSYRSNSGSAGGAALIPPPPPAIDLNGTSSLSALNRNSPPMGPATSQLAFGGGAGNNVGTIGFGSTGSSGNNTRNGSLASSSPTTSLSFFQGGGGPTGASDDGTVNVFKPVVASPGGPLASGKPEGVAGGSQRGGLIVINGDRGGDISSFRPRGQDDFDLQSSGPLSLSMGELSPRGGSRDRDVPGSLADQMASMSLHGATGSDKLSRFATYSSNGNINIIGNHLDLHSLPSTSPMLSAGSSLTTDASAAMGGGDLNFNVATPPITSSASTAAVAVNVDAIKDKLFLLIREKKPFLAKAVTHFLMSNANLSELQQVVENPSSLLPQYISVALDAMNGDGETSACSTDATTNCSPPSTSPRCDDGVAGAAATTTSFSPTSTASPTKDATTVGAFLSVVGGAVGGGVGASSEA